MNKSIVILGSGRSGTSFLANLLHSNGVYSGDCTNGTRENLGVRKINEDYLEKYYNGITRSKTPYGIISKDEIKVNEEYQSKSKKFVEDMSSNSSESNWWDNTQNYWMMKDPRTTLLHDMWVKHFDIVIGVFRNPSEVTNSYMKLLDVYFPNDKQEGYDIMLNYWKRFNQSLLDVFENSNKEKYLINFNGDVSKQIKNLFRNLEINLVNYNYNEDRKNQNTNELPDDMETKEIYDKLRNMENLT